ILGFANSGVRIIPSVTTERRSGSVATWGGNLDTSGHLTGADISVLAPLSDTVDVSFGAGIGRGSRSRDFGPVTSVTELTTYSLNAGITAELYNDETIRVTVGEWLGFYHLHADYDLFGPAAEATGRLLENRVSLAASYALSDAAPLDADVSLVHLLVAETLPGEDPLDRTYGMLSLGASHDMGDAATLYGRIGTVVGSSQGSTFGKIGMRINF